MRVRFVRCWCIEAGWRRVAAGQEASSSGPMPFKHHAARRRHIPKARHRIQNWPAYETGLEWRGDLTLWLDEAALAGWRAPRRTRPDGQPTYSNLAIELVLTLRLVST